MITLTLEQKLTTLMRARTLLGTRNNSFCCTSIGEALSKYTDEYISHAETTKYIPEFTKDNAKIVCVKHNLTLPKVGDFHTSWWGGDILLRKKFLTAFIKELKEGNL